MMNLFSPKQFEKPVTVESAEEPLDTELEVDPDPESPKEPEPQVAVPSTNWIYSAQDEDMGRGVIRYATIVSETTVDFDFPYNGEQHATLTLRKHPEHGNDIIVSIERGQILVDMFGETRVPVRFDEKEIRKYAANPAADHSSEMVFLQGFDRFIDQVKKSKKLRIELQFFQEGSNTFEFDITGFDYAKFSKLKPGEN